MQRNDFITEIDNILINDYRFEKQADNVYVGLQQTEQPGATININGQVIQQPGQIIINRFVITCLGPGWVSNVDDTDKREFEQVRYQVFQNDTEVSCIEECIYFEDFKCIMNNFLQK